MNRKIRKARIEDAEAFIAIKDQLSFQKSDGSSTKGGFLLGTDLNTYRKYIRESLCYVAEVDEKVVGFGIVIHDEQMRASDIWTRRHQAKWTIDIDEYEQKKLCYFEQLAFLSGYRSLVVLLAYQMAKESLDSGAEFLFTTTVRKPIINLAAVPFILSVEGKKVGQIDEVYPIVGPILSDIYLVDLKFFKEKAKQHRLYSLIERNRHIL